MLQNITQATNQCCCTISTLTGQRDRDHGRQTDPLIQEHYENGINALHEGDHHLLTQQSRDTVLGWSWEAKVKWLKLMVVAKEFKEVEPDLRVYPCPESVRHQQQFMLNWLNSDCVKLAKLCRDLSLLSADQRLCTCCLSLRKNKCKCGDRAF
jgi:hypothetical protein